MSGNYIPFKELCRNHDSVSLYIKEWLFEKFGYHSINFGYHDIIPDSERIWRNRNDELCNEMRGMNDFTAIKHNETFHWEVKTNGEKWNNAAIEASPLALHMRNYLEKGKKCVYFYFDLKNEIKKYFWVNESLLPFLDSTILLPKEQRYSNETKQNKLDMIGKYLKVYNTRELLQLTSTRSGDEFVRILYNNVLKLDDFDNFIPPY